MAIGGPYSGYHLWSQNNYASAVQLYTGDYGTPWTPVYGYSGAQDWGWDYCGANGGYGADIIGIYGRAGYYVDALGFICTDGTNTFYQPSTPAGGSGGDYFEDWCGLHEMVMGFRGRAGAWLDQFAIDCETP